MAVTSWYYARNGRTNFTDDPGSQKLPRCAMFRREGWDLLPAPRWDAWVFYIWHTPRREEADHVGRAGGHSWPFVVAGG